MSTISSLSAFLRSNDFWAQFKSHGPRLVPFFKTLAAYFVIFIPSDRPSIFSMVLKCLPISALVLFVCLHGIRTNDKQHKFSRRILLALIFSMIGDACLIWPNFFIHGMASFALAQICYCWAFGFEKPNYVLGFAIYLLNAIGLGILLPNMENVPAPVKVGLPVYSMLLMTMAWRSIDRPVNYVPSWTNTCSGLGGGIFVVSDMILGFNMFYSKIPHAQALVMSTYYVAQLLLTLSIVNSHSAKDIVNNSLNEGEIPTITKDEVQPAPESTFATNNAINYCSTSKNPVKSSL